MKLYAVANGRKPGVFLDWPSTQAQVSGFPGAVYQSFNTNSPGYSAGQVESYLKSGNAVGSKFYGVSEGKTKGVFLNWADAQGEISGYQGAKYRGFASFVDALDFAMGKEVQAGKAPVQQMEQVQVQAPAASAAAKPVVNQPSLPDVYAFVDGSFNTTTRTYGYGGFLMVRGRSYPLEGSGNDPSMQSMQNVAGEISGAMAAVKKAEELGIRNMTLLYDYRGIESWANGDWAAKTVDTQAYRDFMRSPERSVEVNFQKVPAHSGIEGNEMADAMAKHAVGIPLTRKEQNYYNEGISRGNRDGFDLSGLTGGEKQPEF